MYHEIDRALEFSSQGIEILTIVLIPRKVVGMEMNTALPLPLFIFLASSEIHI